MSETSKEATFPKKMVSLNVAVALGIMCIVLIALIAYFTVTGISAQNSYNNLKSQNKQLQTWLDGNGTLLNQTQADVTNLQNQISSLNSQISQLSSNVTNIQTWLYANESLLSQTESWLNSNITYYNSQITSLQNQLRELESQSYPLNSMWVYPSTLDYSTNNASVGTLFNVTIWANMENGTYSWQVTMNFTAPVFQEVSCGYTAGSTSGYFAGHTIVGPAPVIDNVGGSIEFGESLLGINDYVPEETASLMYAEFNITAMPNAANPTPITGIFDINYTGTTGTFFLDTNGNTINSAANLHDANYTLSYAASPTINSVTQVPDVNSVNDSEPVVVSANVTDNSGTGIANVTIVYETAVNWVTNYTVPMTLNSTSGLYEGTIPGYMSGTVVSYVIRAYDNNGGFTESSPYNTYVDLETQLRH